MAHKTTTQEELYRRETLYMAFELSKKNFSVPFRCQVAHSAQGCSLSA